MTYEAWRISYQSSEQAARAAYAECARLQAKVEAMEQQEPVTAQQRFQRQQEMMPVWLPWQTTEIRKGRPARTVDVQGLDVEYRELYALPSAQPAPTIAEQDQINAEAAIRSIYGAQPTPSEQDESVRKSWARFSHELHRSPDAPYPGMSDAFEQHFSQSFTDREWRAEAATWAAAWKAAKRHGAQPAPSINDGVRKVTLGFRWESEAQHHIPTIEIEFEPVSPESPNDARGWQDRDRLAAMLTPEAKS